jgi:RNA polymerase sigma-70 factor (ECF subfamily)
MAAAQAGDADSYRRLLEAILPRLRALVRSRLRHRRDQDAEDVVQDILLSIHAARATFDPRRPFLPWMNAIAGNRIVDAARRSGRIAAAEMLGEEPPETFADAATNNPDASFGDAEALRRAIAALPRRQRTAVESVKLREMSLKEATVATGMSEGALKVSVHRAIKALRAALAEERKA